MADVVLSSIENNAAIDHEIWISDSDASYHFCNNNDRLYDFCGYFRRKHNQEWQCDDCKEIGKLKCRVLQKNGERLIAFL